MADKNGLCFIGLMLGAATLLVMTIGTVVVGNYSSGKLQFDDRVAVMAVSAVAR